MCRCLSCDNIIVPHKSIPDKWSELNLCQNCYFDYKIKKRAKDRLKAYETSWSYRPDGYDLCKNCDFNYQELGGLCSLCDRINDKFKKRRENADSFGSPDLCHNCGATQHTEKYCTECNNLVNWFYSRTSTVNKNKSHAELRFDVDN